MARPGPPHPARPWPRFPPVIPPPARNPPATCPPALTAEEMGDLFARASNEALAAFGDGGMFCEKYVEDPRHIEVQVRGAARTACTAQRAQHSMHSTACTAQHAQHSMHSTT